MRFVADSMNVRNKLLPRSCRILIEQRLNLIVVLLKERPDLLLLFLSQLQIFRKASKFLVDRLRRMDLLKLLGALRAAVRRCPELRAGPAIPSASTIPYAVKCRFRIASNHLEVPVAKRAKTHI
ncbi:MAG: hypothetical protein DMG61_11910 [Acidobacteria bacterium]|nr:MAG: hypothetical protein DMG61_11910 [Acidobacteriota bacterium]